MNTEFGVGVIPGEQLVALSIDGQSIALPTFGAISVGLLLVKAGLSSATQIMSDESLPGMALMLDCCDKLLATLSNEEA